MPHACGHGFACSNLAGGWRYSSIAVENAAFDARPTHPCGARLHYAAGCRKPARRYASAFRSIMERPCETLFGQNRRQAEIRAAHAAQGAKGGAAAPTGQGAAMPNLRMHALYWFENEPVTQKDALQARFSQEFPKPRRPIDACRGPS